MSAGIHRTTTAALPPTHCHCTTTPHRTAATFNEYTHRRAVPTFLKQTAVCT